MLVYSREDLIVIVYTNLDFQSDKDSRKLTCGSIFTICRGAINWESIKQSYIANSTTDVKYIAIGEAIKEVI